MTETAQVITDELRQWIVDQARAGHGADEVLQAMKASGWQEDIAMAAMEEVLNGHRQVPDPQGKAASSAVAVPALAEGASHQVWAGDRMVRVVLSMEHPNIVVFADLLSAEECESLRALAAGRLARSETVVHATGGSEVNAARTSEGMFFNRGENELVGRIEARLAALLNWPLENGEGLQVLRYAPGAEYKPHFDYFDPVQPGTAAVLRRGGQRVGTVVMYLNTPEQGGATVFPDAGVTVHPIEGHAVFFSYSQPVAATKTLHGGAPVLQGEKWVATKWLRQGRFD
ncbi:MAG: 2OG-Fe(II) oxygenase [Aquabacterium sp.]|jgi:prolyl 4-hydroxylase|uniref:2OG-Fe(II) oxygenase n=1 Tax=Aquabacterium sp. TaxID=1872578 RepID=UPI003BAF1414